MKSVKFQTRKYLSQYNRLDELEAMKEDISIDIATEHWQEYYYLGDLRYGELGEHRMPKLISDLFSLPNDNGEDARALYQAYEQYIEVYLAPSKKHYVFLIANNNGRYQRQARATQSAYIQLMQELGVL